MERLADDRHAVVHQMIRYGITGAGLTAFYSAIYWGTAVLLGVPALIANSLAFAATLVIGYAVHSRWSFRGHGSRDRPLRSTGRFLFVNFAGYLLNSFWVWLIVERSGGSVALSILPIAFVTPWLSFTLNRRWTFGGA